MPLSFPLLQQHVFLRFRRRRMRKFFRMLRPANTTRVLDIGGTPQTWLNEAEGPGSNRNSSFPVTLINIRSNDTPPGTRFQSVQGDATHLPFPDGCFDIAFSNSVIEHVGDWERQQAFAREARRVAAQLWIQTPARSFPIEAHLLAPYIQYLPKPMQHRLARWTLRGLMQPEVVHEIVDEVRLLTYLEMTQLFPDCEIHRERVFGLTKSYVAVRRDWPGAARHH